MRVFTTNIGMLFIEYSFVLATQLPSNAAVNTIDSSVYGVKIVFWKRTNCTEVGFILPVWYFTKSDIFHFSAQNIDCGYSLEPARRGGSNEYHNQYFEQK